MKIYRYQLSVTDEVVIKMPKGAEVLSVGPPRDNSGRLDLWALVEPGQGQETTRRFRIYGTGHWVDETGGKFVGTVSVFDDRLIFHVFDMGEV